MVFEELLFTGQGIGHGYPFRLGCIIFATHGRQLPGREVEIIGVSDGAPALRAVGMIEHGLSLERTLEHRPRQLESSFLAQFTQRAVEQGLVAPHEAAGKHP